MNFNKIIFSAILGMALPASAVPVTIQLDDKIVHYDSEELKWLKSYKIESAISLNQIWNGKKIVPDTSKEIKVQFRTIDSKGFALLVNWAKKGDAKAFAFIDSLNEQAFRLMCMYAKITESRQLKEYLFFKMLQDSTFQGIAEVANEQIDSFINGKIWVRKFPQNEHDWQSIKLEEKYLQRKPAQMPYNSKYSIASLDALLVLIHFYQETMKSPLPLNTQHLKNVFNAQSQEVQQILLSKNLVILP